MLLSVCAIMKNEEEQIMDFINCYKDYADEILIIDNGSTDRTAEIAKSMGCKVIECKDKFDYARNQYITNASSDWILSVDADERMLSSDLEKLRSYLPTCLSDAVILPNLQYYGDGRWATWYLARIFRKNDRVRFDSPIHGSITKSTEGVLGFFSGAIHHYDGIMGMERRYEKRERNVELIKKQIELEPKRSSNYNYLSQELLSLGRGSEALDAIKIGYQLDVDKHTYATLFYSQILYSLEMYDLAEEKAKEQLEISQNKIEAGHKLLHRHIGNADSARVILAQCMFRRGETEKAIACCTEAVSKMPFLAHQYINLYFLTDDKQWIRKAIESNPLLLNNEIYIQDVGPTIYRAQSSMFDDTIISKQKIKKVISDYKEFSLY